MVDSFRCSVHTTRPSNSQASRNVGYGGELERGAEALESAKGALDTLGWGESAGFTRPPGSDAREAKCTRFFDNPHGLGCTGEEAQKAPEPRVGGEESYLRVEGGWHLAPEQSICSGWPWMRQSTHPGINTITKIYTIYRLQDVHMF